MNKRNITPHKEAHDDLELRIREKTAALAETRNALRAEIKARRRAEAALKESNERYSLLEALLIQCEEKCRAMTAHSREMECRLNQAHRTAALGILTGGIAHDFKNILSPITMYAGMASMGISVRDPLHSHMEKILKAAGRGADLIDQLMLFSRHGDSGPRPLMLTPIIKETVKFMKYSVPSTVRISQWYEVASDKVLADPVRIHQVLVNLIINIVQRMGENGGVMTVGLTDRGDGSAHVKSHSRLDPERGYLKLTVTHGECESFSETPPRFEPYDSAKRKRDGIGPGIALVNETVKELKGCVFLNRESERGLAFLIFLPKAEIDRVKNPDARQRPAAGQGRILFVDDDPMVVEAAEVMLGSLGYEVTKAAGSLEALAAFKKTPEDFDLIITDQMMPDMTGEDLCRELLRIRPDIPVILCTGHDEMMNEKLAEKIGIKAFFSKPMEMDETAGTIRRLLDQSHDTHQTGPLD